MLIFGIDTCCMSATAALMSDDVMVAETVINHHRTHSQMMMPQIEEMFRLSGTDPNDVDAFAAAVGPGSFTGNSKSNGSGGRQAVRCGIDP